MKDWKVSTRIKLGFIAVIALSVALGLFAFSRMLIIERNASDIANNNVPSVIALSHVQTELYHVVELLLQHAASGDPHEMDNLEAQIRTLRDTNARAYQTYEALPSIGEERALYEKVKADRAEFWSTLEEVRKTSRLGTTAANAQAKEITESRLRPILQRFVADLQAILDLNNNGSKEGLALVIRSGSSANWGILIGLAASIVIAVPITILIVRPYRRPSDGSCRGS